jgi:hypothetical protein
MRVLSIAMAIVSTMLAACAPVGPAVQTTVQAKVDEPFELRIGQTASLAGADLQVEFTAVPSDGRCPTNINCAETAPVRVVLVARDRDGSTQAEITFHGHTTEEGAMVPAAPDTYISAPVGGYVISLLAVTPYPDAERTTREGDYRIELSVSVQAPAAG